MSLAFPQSVGIGSVAGTALGTVLMAYAGCGETAVYVCAAAGGCLFALATSQVRAAASRARRLNARANRFGGSNARIAALGQ